MRDATLKPLKPCPFCGNAEPVDTPGPHVGGDGHYVDCNACGVQGASGTYPVAIEAWNRRPAEDAANAEIARLREELAAATAYQEVCDEELRARNVIIAEAHALVAKGAMLAGELVATRNWGISWLPEAREWLARNNPEDCPACGGRGVQEGVDSSWTCPGCKGTGVVWPGDGTGKRGDA